MQGIRQLTLACALGSASAIAAAAAPNPLSVHVLDLQSGKPTAGIGVVLEQRVGDQWRELASGVTNAQGRVAALYPEGKPVARGEYRIVFKTGEHFSRRGEASFFPRIPVEFSMDDATQHYHIPLLLSPFGYSTYRGN